MLARLEARASNSETYAPLGESFAAGVEAAIALVDKLTLGELIETAVYTAEIDIGPWISDAPANAAQAYRNAQQRAPIAIAVAEKFGEPLHRPLVGNEQQWWTTNDGTWHTRLSPLFRNFERVYDAGQFTWAGLWTVTDPPDVAHAQLIDAWELYPGPITRWRLPARPDARVFEINRPHDWARLVTEHPRRAACNLEHWELPSPNQDIHSLAGLLGIPSQRAARGTIRTPVQPDETTTDPMTTIDTRRGHNVVAGSHDRCTFGPCLFRRIAADDQPLIYEAVSDGGGWPSSGRISRIRPARSLSWRLAGLGGTRLGILARLTRAGSFDVATLAGRST